MRFRKFCVSIGLACLAMMAVQQPLVFAQTTSPTTSPVVTQLDSVDDVLQVLREPSWGDGSVYAYRKRQACDRITPDLKNAAKTIPDLIRLQADMSVAKPANIALQRVVALQPGLVLDAVRDPNPMVRFGIAKALVPLGKRSESVLADLAENDSDPAVQRVAAYALCAIGSAQASPFMIALLRDNNPVKQREAIAAMKDWSVTPEVGLVLRELMVGNNPALHEPALELLKLNHDHLPALRFYPLKGHGEPGEYETLELLRVYPRMYWGVAVDCMVSPEQRNAGLAREMVGQMGPSAIQWMPEIAALGTGSRSTVDRVQIIDAFNELCDSLDGKDEPTDQELEGVSPTRFMQILISIVGSRQFDTAFKNRCVQLLGRFGDKARPAVPLVIEMANQRPQDAAVVLQFLTRFAPAGHPVDELARQATYGGDDIQRTAAEQYLAACGETAYPQLRVMLTSPRASISAVRIMEKMRVPERSLVDSLAGSVQFDESATRSEALALLISWLGQPDSDQLRVIVATHRSGLSLLKTDPDPAISRQTETLLEMLSQKQPQPVINTAVATATATPTISGSAVKILGASLIGFTGLAIIAVWLVLRSLALQAERHAHEVEQARCVRCDATLSQKTRFCRRCGLGVAS